MCSRCLEKRQTHKKDKRANAKNTSEAVNNNCNKLCEPCTTLPYNVTSMAITAKMELVLI